MYLVQNLLIALMSFHVNRSGQYVWEDHRPRSGVWKGTSGGEVISFSGCDDDQTSADTSVSFRRTELIRLLHFKARMILMWDKETLTSIIRENLLRIKIGDPRT